MLSGIDSFVKHLYAVNATVPVVFVRFDQSNPQSNRMVGDALNVHVLDASSAGQHLETILVSLDVLASEERKAWEWVSVIVEQLTCNVIQEWDYTTSPISETSSCVSWDVGQVRFRKVGAGDRYVHLNATFQIRHVR